jgi:hypothetical protein
MSEATSTYRRSGRADRVAGLGEAARPLLTGIVSDMTGHLAARRLAGRLIAGVRITATPLFRQPPVRRAR